MRIITYVYVCDDDENGIGEVEGMFDETGVLLGAWSLNDASWRNEYFGPWLAHLGIQVVEQEEPTRAQIKALRKHFGFA